MKQLNAEKLNSVLLARLNDNIALGKVGGAKLIVRQDGKTLCKLEAGYQNVLTEEPIKNDAVFRMASMTKPVTAVAALVAEDMGLFKMDDLVSDYLPQFENMCVAEIKGGKVAAGKKSEVPLRIWHMLSHASGMMAATEIGLALEAQKPDEAYKTLATMVEHCASQPLAYEPESYSAYCAYSSFDTVARIIELQSGMEYKDFLKKYIFDPLGMKDTTYTPTEEQWSRVITMTDRMAARKLAAVDLGSHTFEGFPLTYTCAGAGLVSTLDDYSKFAEMLLNNGTLNGVRIFSPERITELCTPRIPAETPGRDPVSSWGLGVRVVDKEDVLPVGCYGWSGAYGTHFWVDPENKITAVYLRNSRWYDSRGGGNIAMEFEKDVVSCFED